MTNRRIQESGRSKGKKRARRAPAEVGVDASLESGDEISERSRTGRALFVGLAKVLVGAAVVLGTAGGLAFGAHRYALTTPRFAIRDVSVEGIHRLTRDQVLLLGGVKVGENVFRLDLEAAERGVQSSPWIASVRISRQLPGSVRIEVVEREPRALLVLGEETWLVSAEAEPFKRVGPGDPRDFPRVTGLNLEALGRDRRAELARLEEALVLLDSYAHLPLASAYPAEEVHLTDGGEAVLTIGDEGTALHLGRPPFKQKLLRAVRVLGKTAQSGGVSGVVFLDNEAHPERVVVRVK